MFRRHLPDITIVSISLEGYSGLTVISAIADMIAGDKTKRLFAMINHMSKPDTSAAFSSGATDIIWKPIFPEFLVRRFNDTLASIALYKTARAASVKWNTLLDLFPDPVTITEFDTGTYIHVNQAYLERARLPLERIIGRTPMELGVLSKDERDKLLDGLKDGARVHGLPLVYREHGVEHHLEVSASVFTESGKTYVLSVTRDITDRVEMVRRNDLLREAVDSVKFRETLSKIHSDIIQLQREAEEMQYEGLSRSGDRAPSGGDEKRPEGDLPEV
jgi:PAS domain S-box-containing protein